MALRDKERYYWLKLDRGFFKRHDISIIEDMPNGKDYVLFYLKLMLESVDHEGALRFSDAIPYNEQMLSSVTRTNVDIVRAALHLFEELGMVEIFDDETLFMTEVAKLLGSETYAARRQRELRGKNSAGDNVARLSPGCRQEKEIEKEAEEVRAREAANDDFSEVMTFYMENISFNHPSSVVTAEIQGFIQDLSSEVVLHAMQIAAERDKHSWPYIKAILGRYRDSGLDTMEKVRLDEAREKSAKKGGAGGRGQGKSDNIFAELVKEGVFDDDPE